MDGSRKKIIIDTDIADDIDDAIALAFALGSPELDILGVTVVYGDVRTRAKVARKLLRSWGRRDVPVRMGFRCPLGFEWFPGAAPEPRGQAHREYLLNAAEPGTPGSRGTGDREHQKQRGPSTRHPAGGLSQAETKRPRFDA